MILVVERVLRAAKHNERVEAVRRFRQRVAGVRAKKARFGAGLGQRRADETESRLRIVLDDEDAH